MQWPDGEDECINKAFHPDAKVEAQRMGQRDKGTKKNKIKPLPLCLFVLI
jgi:hypothetical protein